MPDTLRLREPPSAARLSPSHRSRRCQIHSCSGRNVSTTHNAKGMRGFSRSPRNACPHTTACRYTVRATKYGRTGPSTVLNPAHPTEKKLRMTCNTQHEDDRSPSSDQHSRRTRNRCSAADAEGISAPRIVSPASVAKSFCGNPGSKMRCSRFSSESVSSAMTTASVSADAVDCRKRVPLTGRVAGKRSTNLGGNMSPSKWLSTGRWSGAGRLGGGRRGFPEGPAETQVSAGR